MNTEEILTERGKSHGDYSEMSIVSQEIKSVIRRSLFRQGRFLSLEHQEALDMIGVKIARIVTGDPNVRDHWDDGAGYFTLGARYVKP